MKKIFTIFAVVALMASFASCKKDYTCTCSSTTSGEPTITYTIKDTKSKVTTACTNDQSALNLGGGTYTCTVK